MRWNDRIGRRVKLNDLHILMAVIQFGSMGMAASQLHTSQSAVSRSIADLEHALGVRLLDRGPKGIEPTKYGRALLDCGVAVFDDLRQGVKNIEFLADPTIRGLRIGKKLPERVEVARRAVRVFDQVMAIAARKHIGVIAGAADQSIVARSSVERIDAGSGADDIVAAES